MHYVFDRVDIILKKKKTSTYSANYTVYTYNVFTCIFVNVMTSLCFKDYKGRGLVHEL